MQHRICVICVIRGCLETAICGLPHLRGNAGFVGPI